MESQDHGESMLGSRLLPIAGILAAPFVIASYAGLTVLLLLPLLGLRRMFPRVRIAPLYPGVGSFSSATTRRAWQ